ncbi:hypothetical protein GCM10027451_25920 [Geodermatophilus aquaeductus]
MELRGGIEHRPPLRIGGQLLDALADLLVQGGDPRRSRAVGRLPLRRAQLRSPASLPIRLLPLAVVLVIWTLPELGPTPVREELRNRCPATHSPGPSGKSSAQGPGTTAGDDRTKTASAAKRPKGGRILVRSGGDGAGGPYAELPDGPGDQQGQPAAGGP